MCIKQQLPVYCDVVYVYSLACQHSFYLLLKELNEKVLKLGCILFLSKHLVHEFESLKLQFGKK